MIATITTYTVFCRRGAHQRPRFVILLLLTLHTCWTFSFTYYLLMLIDARPLIGESWTENLIITIADTLYFFFDWQFFQQYLSASLLLPVVLDHTLGREELKSRTARALSTKLLITAVVFSALLAWFICSVVFNMIVVRVSITVIQTVVTVIFISSLYSIKQQLA